MPNCNFVGKRCPKVPKGAPGWVGGWWFVVVVVGIFWKTVVKVRNPFWKKELGQRFHPFFSVFNFFFQDLAKRGLLERLWDGPQVDDYQPPTAERWLTSRWPPSEAHWSCWCLLRMATGQVWIPWISPQLSMVTLFWLLLLCKNFHTHLAESTEPLNINNRNTLFPNENNWTTSKKLLLFILSDLSWQNHLSSDQNPGLFGLYKEWSFPVI